MAWLQHSVAAVHCAWPLCCTLTSWLVALHTASTRGAAKKRASCYTPSHASCQPAKLGRRHGVQHIAGRQMAGDISRPPPGQQASASGWPSSARRSACGRCSTWHQRAWSAASWGSWGWHGSWRASVLRGEGGGGVQHRGAVYARGGGARLCRGSVLHRIGSRASGDGCAKDHRRCRVAFAHPTSPPELLCGTPHPPTTSHTPLQAQLDTQACGLHSRSMCGPLHHTLAASACLPG